MTYVWIGLFVLLLSFILYITISLAVIYRCEKQIRKSTAHWHALARETALSQKKLVCAFRESDAQCSVFPTHYVKEPADLCFALKTVNDQITLYVKKNPSALKVEAAYQHSATYRRHYKAFLQVESKRSGFYDRMEAYRKNIFLAAFAEAAYDRIPPRDVPMEERFGLGLMRLPLLPNGEVDIKQCMEMADCVIQNRFTYFDTAYFYLGGRSEGVAKKILCDRYPRSSFRLADKMPVSMLKEQGDVERIFTEQLERTGAGYFDFYLLHALNDNTYENQTKEFDVFSFVAEQKRKGTVRQMGFSFHDKPEVLNKILTEHPEVDFVQLQLNYYDWETNAVASRRSYEVAKTHGKPIIVMEPVKGGNLAIMPRYIKELIPHLLQNDTPATLALRFAATKEEVMTVLSGMSTMEQTLENVRCMRNMKPLNEDEFEQLLKVASAMRKIPTHACTSCRYCVDYCPRHLPIPDIIQAINRHLKGSEEHVPLAKQCIGCGACESKCPQKLKIRKIMRQGAEL